MVDEALTTFDGPFSGISSQIGRAAIPPEQLLRAIPRVKRLLSQAHFTLDGTSIQAWASIRLGPRSARHPGDAISQTIRKRIEKRFGWRREIGLIGRIQV